MKKKFFVFFFLLPSLLFALNEKECNQYFKNALEEVRITNIHLKNAGNASTEMKIIQLNAAIQCNHRAVINLDVVLNAIHALKSHKLRPWHRDIKAKCKNQKEICFSAMRNMEKSMAAFHILLPLEQKQNEENSWIEIAKVKGEEAKSLSGQPRLNSLYEALVAMQNASSILEKSLLEISMINDHDIRRELFKHEKSSETRLKNLQEAIIAFENNINHLTFGEDISEFFVAGNLKFAEASSLREQTYPLSIKDIPHCFDILDKAIELYQDSISNYKKAYELIQFSQRKSEQYMFKNIIAQLEQIIESCKFRIAESSKDKEIIQLKNYLEILAAQDESISVKRKIKAILEQLVECEIEDFESINMLQDEINILELNHANKPSKKRAILTDDEISHNEEMRREDFYRLKRPNIISEIALAEEVTLSNAGSHNSSYPIIISLDEKETDDDDKFVLSIGQSYLFYVQNNDPPSSIIIDVLEDFKVIHTEKITFPHVTQSEWNDFVIYEGLTRIPESTLMAQFGLDIQLITIPEEGNVHTFIIKQKSENLNYQFTFSIDDSLLYKCSFIESVPWQLENLRNAVNSNIDKPLEKIDPYPACMENSSSPDGIKHTISYPILLNFIEEMKNDPLALAQYVQNEIEFIDPSKHRVNSIFEAPKILRSALGTFLEKKGTAWEQCALLVYLLRNAGYEAFYADGATFPLPADYVEKLLTLKLPGEEKVLFNYPWVFLNDGKQWVTLFPWMKDIKYYEGHNIYDFLPNEYASAERWIQRYLTNDPKILQYVGSDGDDTAGILFIRFLDNELRNQGLSFQDVGIHCSINKKQYVTWQDFPRVEITQNFNQLSDLYPNSNIYTLIEIEIASRENPHKKINIPWAFISDLITNPYTIDFELAGEVEHVLNLKRLCKSELVSQLHLDKTDHNLNVTVSFKLDKSEPHTFTISKGTCAVICFNTAGLNSNISSFFGDLFNNAKEETSKIHSLLAFTGALYFDKCSRAESELAKLHKLSPSTILNYGLAKLAPDISKGPIFDKPDLRFPQVDMLSLGNDQDKNIFTLGGNPNLELARRQLSSLTCVDGSSNEHQVLHEVFKDPYAISTVKLLQIAHEQHQNKGLSGLGFLAFTEKSLIHTEQTPIFAQCFYFNHLKELNLSKVKTQAGTQWNAASQCLKNKDLNQDFSYVYMTPGPVCSKDGDGLRDPSYVGMGTLIIHNRGSCALIDNGANMMNGGYGSRLTDNALFSFVNNDWKIIKKNNAFSLISSEEYPIFNQATYPKSDFFTENGKSEYTGIFHSDADISDIYIYDHIKSDIRQNLKSDFYFVADPVDTVSGAFYIDEVDLSLPGPFPLEVRRNYNNQNPTSGALGFGWKMSLNPYLIEKGDHLFAAEEDGSMIDYRLNVQNGRWEVFPEDNPELLNHNRKGIGATANPYHAYIENNSGLILHSSDGSKRRFQNKLLKEWTNASGNSLIFIYDQERLVRIENLQGGFLGFYYNHEGRISEAYTKDGRRVYYSYDSQGNLARIELPNGGITSYEYDSSHQIIKETKPHGKLLINSYDELGRVIEQLSPNGRQQQIVTTAKFTYGDNTNTATDAAGACTEYKIFQNQIYKITDPEGNQILQSSFIDANTWFDAETEQLRPWNDKGGYPRSPKSSKDKRGLITEYRYDENGNPIQITLNGNDLTGNGDQEIGKILSYNERNLCVLEQVLNSKTITIYDTLHSYLPKRIEKYSEDTLIGYIDLQYNSNGQMIYENNSGAITFWEYDSRGFPIKKIQKSGSEDPDVETLFQYNHQGQCIENKSSDAVIKTDYDIMGNPYMSSVYDLSGDLISVKYANYDLNNALTWQMGSDTNDFTYIDYNAAGLPKVTRQHLSKAIIGKSTIPSIATAGIAYSLFDYDARGHLAQEVDPKGNCTYRDYDLLGRVSKVTRMNTATSYSYEAGGLIYETTFPNHTKTTRKYTTNGLLINEFYPDGTEVSYKYDLFGRPISEIKNNITTNIEYDDALRRVIYKQEKILLKIEEFDLRGNLVALIDAHGNVWTKLYDDLGRLKCDVDPEGNETNWQYHGDSITCILPSKEKNIQRYKSGKVFDSQTFDPQGKLIAHVRTEHSPHTSTYKEIQGDKVTTTWMNTQGKPIAIQQGEIVNINYYDPCGHCVATTDGEGRTTLLQYDSLDRLKKKTLSGGAQITYEYDESSNLTTCNLPGEVSWKASYDLMGRKLSEELQAKDATTQQWKYIYDQGRLIEATDPNLLKHTYSYDNLGRMVEDRVGEFYRSYTFDLRGSLTCAEQYCNDSTKLCRGYDGNGRITSESIYLNSQLIQKTLQSWEPGTRTLQIDDHQRNLSYLGGKLYQVATSEINLNYDYGTDGALFNRSTNRSNISYNNNISGLPKAITTTINGRQYSEALEWDKSGRMHAYQSSWPEIKEMRAYSYNSQGQLKSINDDAYSFDFDKPGCGVRTGSPHWSVPLNGLDPFGKVISEINGGKQINTDYNAAGQVISRFTNEGTQNFKWDPWGNLIEVSCEAYTWSASYDALGRRLQTIYKTDQDDELATISLYDPEKEFDEIGVKYDGKTFWKLIGNGSCDAIIDEKGNSVDLTYDALGSLIAVIDAEKVHWSKESISPYGPRDPSKALEANLISFACAHTWQSRRVDPTGFIWMGARYYDPTGGKFLSSDPVGIPISLDLHSYAGGDPINFNDPDGRFASAVYAKSKDMNFADSFVKENLKNLSPHYIYNNIRSLGTSTTEVYVSAGHVLPNKKIIYSNGILTSLNDAKRVGDMLSELSGGHQVHVVYNPTTMSPVLDGIRWCAGCKFNFKTDVVHKIQGEMDSFFVSASKDATAMLIGFSEGVTSAKNSLNSYDHDLRKRVDALAYCPSAFIKPETCRSVIHYCSEGDVIHRLVCEGFVKGRENVAYLPPHPNAGWIDHAAMSPTFREVLKDEIANYLTR